MNRCIPFLFFVVLLAGCGPKLTPLLAQQSVEQSAVLNNTEAAKVGESLLVGLDMFSYAAYSPRESGVRVLAPHGLEVEPLDSSQKWVAFYRLDDGSLVIEALKSVSPESIRLGLRIDDAGHVLGRRPWFDLTDKIRLNQPEWDGQQRLLFVRNGVYPVDVFTFDLRFSGMKNGKGVFAYQEFKERGMRADEHSTLILSEGESVQLHGLKIRIFALYPDHVRYVVEPVR